MTQPGGLSEPRPGLFADPLTACTVYESNPSFSAKEEPPF